ASGEREVAEHARGQRDRVVPGEDGGRGALRGRAEAAGQVDVRGGTAAALHVSVHPIVVDEEVGLQELEGHARLDGDVEGTLRIDRAGADADEGRAQALASATTQIPEGRDHLEDLTADGLRSFDALVQDTREARFDF